MVHPKKHLGQHFLIDHNIAEKIILLLDADRSETIVEIGPGKGVLTQFLAKRNDRKLVLVEIDGESVDYLRTNYPELQQDILQTDFLTTDLEKFGTKISIIGNFPYNISSQIFFHILDYRESVNEVVCMIQKEVALRLASDPGSKQYGILSVLLQTWYDIKVEFHVRPGAFFPPPAVQSTVIKLRRNNRKNLICDERNYRRIIKMAFNQRRKVINNSLRSILVNLDSEIPYLRKRPEELSVEQFIELCTAIEGQNP